MKRKKFITYMNKLLEIKKAGDQVSTALKQLGGEDFNSFSLGQIETLIVDLLRENMNDLGDDWIGYWLYELDCGKEARKDSVTENGKNIPIKTLDDLYNILTKCKT